MPRVHQIERERVVLGLGDTKSRGAAAAVAAVNYVLGFVEILLAFRFFFLLFGANRGNAFVDLIYSLSGPLVAPFRGIFSNVQEGFAVFDWSTILAMFVYGVIAYLIVRLLSPDQLSDDAY